MNLLLEALRRADSLLPKCIALLLIVSSTLALAASKGPLSNGLCGFLLKRSVSYLPSDSEIQKVESVLNPMLTKGGDGKLTPIQVLLQNFKAEPTQKRFDVFIRAVFESDILMKLKDVRVALTPIVAQSFRHNHWPLPGWNTFVERELLRNEIPLTNTPAALANVLRAEGLSEGDIRRIIPGRTFRGRFLVISTDMNTHPFLTPFSSFHSLMPSIGGEPGVRVWAEYVPTGHFRNSLLSLYDTVIARFFDWSTLNQREDIDTGSVGLGNLLKLMAPPIETRAEMQLRFAERRELLLEAFSDVEGLDLNSISELRESHHFDGISIGGSKFYYWFIPVTDTEEGHLLVPVNRFDPSSLIRSYRHSERVTKERVHQRVTALLRYAASASATREDRELASSFGVLNEELYKAGGVLTPNQLFRSATFSIEGLDGAGFGSLTSSLNPFGSVAEGVTPWSELPPRIRNVFETVFSQQSLVASACLRIERENRKHPIVRLGDRGYRVGTPYISFIHDWNLFSRELKQAVLRRLTPSEGAHWLKLVKLQSQAK